MRRGQSVGLIGAGKLTDSPLVRLWTSRERLGPVKAPTMRVASRISNNLRAGHPVADYQEFEECGLILISIPDSLLPNALVELSSYPLTWTTKAVVLCSALLGAMALDRLAVAGASVGSLCSIPGFEDRWFLLEGDKLVESRMRQIVDEKLTRFTLIRPPCKPLYLTALAFTGSMFTPMLMKASDSLRQAGIPVTESEAIIEKQVERCMRAYFRAGRKVPGLRMDVSAPANVRSQHA